LIDGIHFSDVIDVMARRGANIDPDHILVVIKLRARICRASNTKPEQLTRFAVGRLKDRDVASRYYDELEYEYVVSIVSVLSGMQLIFVFDFVDNFAGSVDNHIDG
jgi:hypothetical protein